MRDREKISRFARGGVLGKTPNALFSKKFRICGPIGIEPALLLAKSKLSRGERELRGERRGKGRRVSKDNRLVFCTLRDPRNPAARLNFSALRG
jgi:hypothetical protein